MEKPTRRGRGRPSKLKAEVAERILKLVKQGLPIELAAEASLVSRETVLEWVRRGEGRDNERPATRRYRDFANRYRQARAEFAAFCMQPCLQTIAGKRPHARKKGPDGRPVMVKALGAPTSANEAHWHLARRFPGFWGSGVETFEATEVARSRDETANDGVPQIIIKLPELPPEDEPEADTEMSVAPADGDDS